MSTTFFIRNLTGRDNFGDEV